MEQQEKRVSKLDDLAGGAVSERFNVEFGELMQNVYDPNTDAEKVRKIQLTISVKPSKNRDAATFTYDIKKTPAPLSPITSTVLIAQRDDGTIVATERTAAPAGQMDMFGGEVTPNVIEFGQRRAN